MTKPLLTGVLKTWKEDRGFGFISPDNGGRDVFIHVSAIAETSRRPIPGDIVHYNVVRDRNGKFRAVNASLEGVVGSNKSVAGVTEGKRGLVVLTVALIVIAAVAAYFYYRSLV
jgi:cold shock protein